MLQNVPASKVHILQDCTSPVEGLEYKKAGEEFLTYVRSNGVKLVTSEDPL
jgi:hypothetical protein